MTITTVDNSISSGNKTVTVSSTVGNSIGTGSVTDATLTIIDDEVAQVTLVLTPSSITENAQGFHDHGNAGSPRERGDDGHGFSDRGGPCGCGRFYAIDRDPR